MIVVPLPGMRASRTCEERYNLNLRQQSAYTHRSLVWASKSPTFRYELIARGRLVDAAQLLLIWTCLVGDLAGGTSEDVTANDGEVREQLADFGVGEDE